MKCIDFFNKKGVKFCFFGKMRDEKIEDRKKKKENEKMRK
jgi:hypothetical protein